MGIIIFGIIILVGLVLFAWCYIKRSLKLKVCEVCEGDGNNPTPCNGQDGICPRCQGDGFV